MKTLSKYLAGVMVKTSTISANVLVVSSRFEEKDISLSENDLDKLKHLIKVRWEGIYEDVLNRTRN